MNRGSFRIINFILLITIFSTLFSKTTFAKEDEAINEYKLSGLTFSNEINTGIVFEKTAIRALQKLLTLENSTIDELNEDNSNWAENLLKDNQISNSEINSIKKIYKKSFNDIVNEYSNILEDEYIENRILKTDKVLELKHELTIYLHSYLSYKKITEEENILIYYILFNFYQSDQIVVNNAIQILDYFEQSSKNDSEQKFLNVKHKNALKDYALAEKMLNKNLSISASKQYLNAYRSVLKGIEKSDFSFDLELYKLDIDSDNDEIEDGKELLFSMNPLNEDSDGDGLNDKIEFNLYPKLSPIKYDTDNNGISDLNEDIDMDDLDNEGEILYNTILNKKDTDDDGLTDGFEINEFNTLPTNIDTDNDGLSDFDEFELGTDPNNSDSDNDGIIDSMEIFEQTFIKDMSEIDETNQIINVEVTLSTNENLNQSMNIHSTKGINMKTSNLIGLVGNPVEISTKSNFETAVIRFNYNESMLDGINEEDLVIVWFNEEEGIYELLDSVVDEDNNTISVETTHFSEYMIVNKAEWFEHWNRSLDYTRNSDSSDPLSTQYYDIVFAIDSSGSMMSNDPSGLRKEAAKQFVDAFYSEDQGAVVDFDSSAYILVHLTQDKDEIKTAINSIDSSGGTNINNAVNLSIDELESSYSNENNEKIIILLTDGAGTYYNSTTNRAIENGIKIYTVGLGSRVNSYLLNNIAESTGGKYYYAVVSEELEDIFHGIEEETIGNDNIDSTDTDGDGLYDTLEIKGMKTPYGIIYTDHLLADTDGDGISDYDEMFGEFTYIIDNYTMFYPNSLPNLYDSDDDGIYDMLDSKPLKFDVKDALVFQSDQEKGFDENGNVAVDMTYNDYTRKQLTDINILFWNEILFSDTKELFEEFEEMSTDLFATGDMEDVIIDMINHFENGNGSEYSNETLTEEAKKHESTEQYIELVKNKVIEELKSNNGELTRLVLDMKDKESSNIYKYVQKNATYPNYSTFEDQINGLTITVHDTWGNTVEVKDYSLNDGHFEGTLKFNIYDHFGLDEGDLVWYLVPLAGFRSWFTLQHYDKYDGLYKPFVTNIDIEIPFEGDIDD